ncbi:hypothetical protein LTR95_006142 [Oleoguttula sp. CCFEE 5521]
MLQFLAKLVQIIADTRRSVFPHRYPDMSTYPSAACYYSHRGLGLEHHDVECLDRFQRLDTIGKIDAVAKMIIDAPEIFSEQVAVEVSLKLSQKCAEEGNTFAMIRLMDLYDLRSRKADAVGWIMLARLGGDTDRIIQDAVRDVVCWDYGDLPAILTTNPLGAHRFTG